jgi:hypothetical protein
MEKEKVDTGTGIINNINYIYNCAKGWFKLLVGYDEQDKENETYTNPETKFRAGIPEYILPYPSSPGSSQGNLTQNSDGQITPDQSPAQTRIQIVPGSETRRPLTEAELKDALAKTTSTLGTLQENDSSDEETPDEGKKWAIDVISRASATNYSESYSQSIAELSNALSDMDTTALSAALNAANVDISDFIQNGKSTKACQIIARIMFDEQFGSAREIGSRGKSNEQQMREIWGNDITNMAKSYGSLCYLCTGQLVAGGQAEMEHRMKCGEFYAIFAYIYSLYPKELEEWRYYVNKVADTEFKKKLSDYYYAVNMRSIDETELKRMYDDIIEQFKKDTGITSENEDYAKFTKLLRAYLHEFAYAHHVCNQIKCDHDLDDMKNVDKYYNIVKQHLAGAQPSEYNPKWKHMQIKPAFSQAEIPQITLGLKQTNLTELEDRIVNQMKLLHKFSEEIRDESGETQNRMILRILKDALINMNDKKGTTDPSNRITNRIKEQANLLAQGANFYNNDITDASEFNKDFNPPHETPSDDIWPHKLFKNRLPRFLDRIITILRNTLTYASGPNTLDIIGKCLKSPPVSDFTRDQILRKLNGYIRVLTEINNKVMTILNYPDLPNKESWTEVRNYLNNYLDELNTLSKVERRPAGALIQLERWELNRENPGTNSLGAQKDNQSSVSTGRAQSSNAATFASSERNMAGQNTAGWKRRRSVSRKLTDAELKILEENEKIKMVIQQNIARDVRAQSSNAATFASSERNMAGQNTAGPKRRRPESRKLTDAELKILEAKEDEERRQEVRKQKEDRAMRAQSGYMVKNKVKTAGGRRRQIRKTRKLKRRPRKITQRAGQRKRTMKRKYRSRKNTRRRR